MASIHTYLTFPGNTEEVFNFYRSVFGGEFKVLQRFKDMGQGDKISDADAEKIMHVALPVGNQSVLMGNDSISSFGPPPQMGNNIAVSLDAESEDEAKRLFDGLSAGGKITMPMEKTFWDAYFGMFTDKFGINWMVNYDYNKPAK